MSFPTHPRQPSLRPNAVACVRAWVWSIGQNAELAGMPRLSALALKNALQGSDPGGGPVV